MPSLDYSISVVLGGILKGGSECNSLKVNLHDPRLERLNSQRPGARVFVRPPRRTKEFNDL